MVVSKQKYFWLFALLALSSPVWAVDHVDAPWELTKEEMGDIQQGNIVVHKQSQGYKKEIHAFLRIDAPPQQMLATITDYKKLPEFMPHLEAANVLQQDEQGALVNYILVLPFGVQKRYRLQLTYDTTPPDLAMHWHKVEWQGLDPDETIQDSTGYWFFKHADKQTTLLHYYTKTDPGHVPFGLGWIVDYLTEKTVVDLLKNTKARAEQEWHNKAH